jgi:hypothetical protein
MLILCPVEEEHHHVSERQRVYEIAQELLRRFINPLAVLDAKHNELLLALPKKEVSYSLENQPPLLHGFQTTKFLVISVETEYFLKWG